MIGTSNVLEAARTIRMETFVNISTDKAASPSCVLGHSKPCAELLTPAYASRGAGTYVTVRLGNVLSSQGSVIIAFTAQIENCYPVTATHPEVQPYFMLILKACQLLLQASAIGRDGEAMVLEMSSPMKIVDIAPTLIQLSGKNNVEVSDTGLPSGEGERSAVLTRRGHKSISAPDGPPHLRSTTRGARRRAANQCSSRVLQDAA